MSCPPQFAPRKAASPVRAAYIIPMARVVFCTPEWLHGANPDLIGWLRERGHEAWFAATPNEAMVRPEADMAILRTTRQLGAQGILDAQASLVAYQAQGAVAVNSLSSRMIQLDKRLFAQAMDRHSLPHPRVFLPGEEFQAPVMVKPARGTMGERVTYCPDMVSARAALSAGGPNCLVQQYLPAATLRVIATPLQAVLAYEKCDDSPVSSVSKGAEVRPLESIPAHIESLACRVAAAVQAEITGIDLLLGQDGRAWALEANSTFRIPMELEGALDLIGEALLGRLESIGSPDPDGGITPS